MRTVGSGAAVVMALAVYVALAALAFGLVPRRDAIDACTDLTTLVHGRPAAASSIFCRLAAAAD